MPFAAIIFDCDGTLVDSETLACRVICRAAADIGLHIELEDAIASFVGHRDAENMRDIEGRLGRPLPSGFEDRLHEDINAALRTALQPVDGARALVESVTVPRCVASSGRREKLELSLRLTGLRPLFGDRIFSAYDVGTWKPDPGLFLHAADAMGVDPAACAVVEDSDPGIEAGLSAGMTVFAYRPCGRAVPDGVTAVRRLADLHHRLGA